MKIVLQLTVHDDADDDDDGDDDDDDGGDDDGNDDDGDDDDDDDHSWEPPVGRTKPRYYKRLEKTPTNKSHLIN